MYPHFAADSREGFHDVHGVIPHTTAPESPALRPGWMSDAKRRLPALAAKATTSDHICSSSGSSIETPRSTERSACKVDVVDAVDGEDLREILDADFRFANGDDQHIVVRVIDERRPAAHGVVRAMAGGTHAAYACLARKPSGCNEIRSRSRRLDVRDDDTFCADV